MEINKASAEIKLGPVVITIKQGTEEAPLTKEQLRTEIERKTKEVDALLKQLNEMGG